MTGLVSYITCLSFVLFAQMLKFWIFFPLMKTKSQLKIYVCTRVSQPAPPRQTLSDLSCCSQ